VLFLKIISKVVIIFIVIPILFSNIAFSSNENEINLTDEEQQWLLKNKNRTFVLGIDPYTGIEYFKYRGKERGYLFPFIKTLSEEVGLNIKLEASKNWGEVYSGLQSGSIDILLGANETQERKEFMAFTRPINKYSYSIVSKIDSDIHTVGDLDGNTVGFVKDDYVIEVLPKTYKNINYEEKYYPSQEEGIASLNNDEIQAFIMPGGPVVYDYIYRYPELKYAFKLTSITSDLTLSARKEDEVLISILDKEIQHLEKNKLPQMKEQSKVEYNLKIMNLTPREIEWVKEDGKAIVGITKDYLPFDYYENGIYKGISGQIIAEISRITGIKFINEYDEFDALNEKLKIGEIDILNIAKTEDRMEYVLYPRPYSTERDIIIGRKDSKDVRDIFGLEGERVAVIKGFWHFEHLMKNLTNVKIIETNSIQESLNLVHKGKADYLIENPTVVRYYIDELKLHDLVERGVTSTD
jgi:diguanylate cyclase